MFPSSSGPTQPTAAEFRWDVVPPVVIEQSPPCGMADCRDSRMRKVSLAPGPRLWRQTALRRVRLQNRYTPTIREIGARFDRQDRLLRDQCRPAVSVPNGWWRQRVHTGHPHRSWTAIRRDRRASASTRSRQPFVGPRRCTVGRRHALAYRAIACHIDRPSRASWTDMVSRCLRCYSNSSRSRAWSSVLSAPTRRLCAVIGHDSAVSRRPGGENDG